jgi:hypothetical protein
MVYKRPNSKYWWFKFTWNGQPIRESTKQANKRVAEQMEAARRTALAKGEVGIRDTAPVPTLKEFAERDFLPFIKARFENKPKTLEYYEQGLKNLTGVCDPERGPVKVTAYEPLANCPLDSITDEKISGFIAKRRNAGLEVTSINRQPGGVTSES